MISLFEIGDDPIKGYYRHLYHAKLNFEVLQCVSQMVNVIKVVGFQSQNYKCNVLATTIIAGIIIVLHFKI